VAKITQYDIDIQKLNGRIAVIKQRLKNMDENLILQAAKDKQHMENLNHENERILAMENKFPDKESVKKDIESINDRMDRRGKDVDEKLLVLSNYVTAQQGRSSLERFIPWIGMGISILLTGYAIFKK